MRKNVLIWDDCCENHCWQVSLNASLKANKHHLVFGKRYLVKSLLVHPLANTINDLNAITTYRIHRQIILSKPFLKNIYQDFYNRILRQFKGRPLESQKIIEIGAGGFNANAFFPSIITTDLQQTEFIKQTEDAHALSFADNSLDGIIFIDVLHHLPEPRRFFGEAQRCLKPGAKLVFIEPYYSPWGSFVYKNVHHEPWSDSPEWEIIQSAGGRLTDANMMMPYNIFIRDRAVFAKEFPSLDIIGITKFNFFSYIISGGLTYRSIVPGFCAPAIFFLEKLLAPLRSLLAMSMVIEIHKKPPTSSQ